MIYSNQDFGKEFEYFKDNENRKHPRAQLIKTIMKISQALLLLLTLSSLYLITTQPFSGLTQVIMLVLLPVLIICVTCVNLENLKTKRYEYFLSARYRDSIFTLLDDDDSKIFIEINREDILEKVKNDRGVCGDLALWIYDNAHSDKFIQEISFNKAYLTNRRLIEQL